MPTTRSAVTRSHGPWQIAATGMPPGMMTMSWSRAATAPRVWIVLPATEATVVVTPASCSASNGTRISSVSVP